MALSFVDEVQVTAADGSTTRVTVELVPGGGAMEVNDTNKAEYVRRLVHYRLAGSVMQQVRFSHPPLRFPSLGRSRSGLRRPWGAFACFRSRFRYVAPVRPLKPATSNDSHQSRRESETTSPRR
jgi:hypothetical protein